MKSCAVMEADYGNTNYYTVVCNNGRTYYLIKSAEYNVGDSLKYYDELFENIEIKNTVKEFLRTCKKVGLSFYYGG